MKKRSYRSINVKKVDANRLAEEVCGQRVVFGIDVGKERVLGALMLAATGEVKLIISWRHTAETLNSVELVTGLPVSELEVALEPSGTYGDPLRWQFAERGVAVYRVSPKRSHDAAEVFDGVPSWHDPKSATLIGKLHLEGASELWPLRPEEERDLAAEVGLMEMYDKQEHANLNRLEAQMGRYWPELCEDMALKRRTVLELIQEYGSPQAVASDEEGARRLMRRIGGTLLKEDKIERVIEGAGITLGMVMTERERAVVQELAEEVLRCRARARVVQLSVEAMGENLQSVHRLGPVVGKTTAAVLVSKVGDPARYESASSFVKALGLNLKERSSGKLQGQLKITKRGPGTCRFYLYMAALRLIMRDPVTKVWYERKVARQGGKYKNKAVVAVMRKLAAALWHVARGKIFDSKLLYDAAKLGFGGKSEASRTQLLHWVDGGQVGMVVDPGHSQHTDEVFHQAGLI